PVLSTGRSEVLISPGVKENGISATRKVYPFYEPFDTVVDLQQESTLQIVPKFNYYPNTKFALNESFEGAGWTISPGTTNDADIDTASFMETHPTYGGEHCLKTELTASRPYL